MTRPGLNAATSAGQEAGPASLPGLLSCVAGLVDVTSWLTLGGLFAAHITGNLVVGAADLVRGRSPAVSAVLAVVVFIVGTVLTDMVTRRWRAQHRPVIGPLLLVQSALLLLTCLLAGLGRPTAFPHTALALLVAVAAVAAMAVQNALLHLTRKSAPTTAVMTGNLVVATLALTDLWLSTGDERAQAAQRWHSTWPLLAGFLIGCLVGAGAVALVHDWAWTVSALVSVGVLGLVQSPTAKETATGR